MRWSTRKGDRSRTRGLMVAHVRASACHARAVQWLRRLVKVLYSAGRRYGTEGFSARAAGIEYRVLFSLAPLAIVLVSVFGLVLQNTELKQDVVDRIVSVLPVDAAGHARRRARDLEHRQPRERGRAGQPVVFLWAATGMMGAIRSGLQSAISPDDKRPL